MTKPSSQPVPHTALQTPKRPRRGTDPGTEKRRRPSPSIRLTVDGYQTDDDDPSIVPWGYFEDDDL